MDATSTSRDPRSSPGLTAERAVRLCCRSTQVLSRGNLITGFNLSAVVRAQPQSVGERCLRKGALPTCPVWAAICIHVSRAAFLWRRRLLSEGRPMKSLGCSLQGDKM